MCIKGIWRSSKKVGRRKRRIKEDEKEKYSLTIALEFHPMAYP